MRVGQIWRMRAKLLYQLKRVREAQFACDRALQFAGQV
jgi:predicted RNA polymerase sigma factor